MVKMVGSWMLSLMMVLTLVLSACAAPQKSAPSPTPERPSAAGPSPAAPQLTREQQLIEGARKEGVVVYWTHTFPNPEVVLKPFKEKYPFLEVRAWNASGGQEITAKTTEEAKAGRYAVDVISTAEKDFFPSSLWKDLIAEYEWPNTRNWPFQRAHNYYRNFTGTVFGTSYNAERLAPADAPKSWEDLNNTKWRGKAVISVSSNDVPLYFAYVWGEKGKLNWDKSFAFWRDVMNNARPRVVKGFTSPLQLHAAGESPLFIMTSLPRAIEYSFKGAPVEVAIVPKVQVSQNLIAVAKNAPHPNAARLFADYLTSTEGQLLFANASINVAIDPDAAKKARGNMEFARRGITLDETPPEFVTEENYKKSTDFWLTELGRQG